MIVLHIEPLRYNAETRALLDKQCQVDYEDVADKGQLIQLLSRRPYEALFVKLGIGIDREVLDAAPNLRYIVTPTTGLNHIDMEEAAKRDIRVLSLKGEFEFLADIKSTAEHTWMLLLALIRKLPKAFGDVLQQKWLREPYLGMELNHKTLGIIGYGRLGRIVAEYGHVFGMDVLINDTDPNQVEEAPEHLKVVDLPELLAKSDVICLHIPSNEANYHFVGRSVFQQMKPGAVFINTSRGEVMDQSALLEVLQNGSLRAAATDVIEGDSTWDHGVPANHPLIEYAKQHDNLLITPHIGGYALESIEGTRTFVCQKFLNEIQ